MSHDRSPTGPHDATPAAAPPVGLWLLWALPVAATATWVAWPALRGEAPLDLARLVTLSALAGLAGLLALTVLEIRLAPWHFLD